MNVERTGKWLWQVEHIRGHLWHRYSIRRVWRYQRGNQNPYIAEQTTQWPKEKVQIDKERSAKHTHKTNDRVTRTPLKSGGELRCSGWVSSSCSTICTSRVNLVTYPVIRREWGKDREVLTTSGRVWRYQRSNQNPYIRGHLWHRYSIAVNQVMVETVKLSKSWFHLNQEEPLVQ